MEEITKVISLVKLWHIYQVHPVHFICVTPNKGLHMLYMINKDRSASEAAQSDIGVCYTSIYSTVSNDSVVLADLGFALRITKTFLFKYT